MLAGRDAFQDLDADALLEQVVEDDQSFEEVAAEPVDLLGGEQVAVADAGERLLECGPAAGLELSADLFLDTFQQTGSRASCCRWVFCLSALTRTRPMSAMRERLSFAKRAAGGR